MPYTTEWEPTKNPDTCPYCREAGHLEYRLWEASDGGHEDYHYQCKHCKKDWWVDGVDS